MPVARRSRLGHVFAVVAAVAALAACSDVSESPEFSAASWPDGAPTDVTDLRGSAVLLAGWATWCVPCERELPMLDEFAATAAAENVEIVAVNVDRADVADGDLEAMLDRLDVDLPVWRDRAKTFLAAYEGTMMPYSVLLDRDGAVARSWVGSLDTDSDEFLAAVAEVSG